MKGFASRMKALFWVGAAMIVVGGLLGGMHPVAIVAGLAILGVSYWVAVLAFTAAFKLVEKRSHPPHGR